MTSSLIHSARRQPSLAPVRAMAALLCVTTALPGFANTRLADQPLFSNTTVPGNVALALSVEYPTAVRIAHTVAYAASTEFLGYFDPNKCYTYNNGPTEADKYFIPAGRTTSRTCSAKWSGNFLNWALMQTIDPFRWAMTGGYRVRDEVGLTVLERAWRSNDDTSLSPDRTLGAGISGATPFATGTITVRTAQSSVTNGMGNKFRFTVGGNIGTNPSPYNNEVTGTTNFEAYARVKVCDPTVAGGGVEANCKQYGINNWKPEGLIQQYADRMRFSAFGYMNHSSNARDGGVMRSRQKFVGPTAPTPGSPAAVNPRAEWDPLTGVFLTNPDSADATATNGAYRGAQVANVVNSGVMNYLNKFGQIYPTQGFGYKSNDPVSEMYYAVLRYYRNLGNVAAWSNIAGGASDTDVRKYLDGFPVITNWDDPIQYSCQRNFVIGIGDINTHADRNVPGNTQADLTGGMPTFNDTWNAQTATNKIGVMQNYQANNPLGTFSSGRGNGFLMAGLAYLANTGDIRPDNLEPFVEKAQGRQSVQTYWVDVLETGFAANNQFYLAAKYGGFNVPTSVTNETPWNLNRTDPLPESWWRKAGDTVDTSAASPPRPDNYFTAGRPDQMVSGLAKLFADLASKLRTPNSSFSFSAPQVAETGGVTYGASYDVGTWSGELTASNTTFVSGSSQNSEVIWRASERIATQFSGNGWDANRRIATRTDAGVSIPFRYEGLSPAQKTALDTAYRNDNDGAAYLQYLRGSRTNEMSAANPGDRFYRTRDKLLGDIVGSKVRPVGAPNLSLSDSTNPGYESFKAARRNRPTVVYLGANDGMLHAFRGVSNPASQTDGQELFAYVPNAVFNGPTNTPGANGLAALGNPDFVHRHFVNAPPQVYDVDFKRTVGGVSLSEEPAEWRSVLIGGLGKGGKSYYAIDVTNPESMTTEAAVASKVLWEFKHEKLGYTFGEPAVIKTLRYGWVVILPSGYNNSDGQGYLFVLNPRTGALLEDPIPTGFGSTAADAGLAHVNTFVNDRTDGTADAAYAGDLHGNVWRVDLSSVDQTPRYTAKKLTTVRQGPNLLDPVQPITSRPRVEVSLKNGKRYVLFGTGRLLDDTDVSSAQPQNFYGLWDGSNESFNRDTDNTYFPIARSALSPITNLDAGLGAADSGAKGWYIDLGSEGGLAWRVITEPAIDAPLGLVGFTPMLPNGRACSPGGNSKVYVIDYALGTTALRTENDANQAFLSLTGIVTDFDFISQGGRLRGSIIRDEGAPTSPRIAGAAGRSWRLLNWRELKSLD